MIPVLSPHYKTYLRHPLIFFCWVAFMAASSQAAITSEALSPDLSRVQEALNDEDPELAEKLLRDILQENENNALAHRLRGIALQKRGLRNDAIAAFTSALQIDPLDEVTKEYLFSIYYNRAQELLNIPEETFKAREELEKAIAVRPDGTMSYYFLGTLNYREKRDAECISSFLRVIETVPEPLQQTLHAMLYNSAFNLLQQKRALEAKNVVPYLSTPQATDNELLLAATISLEIEEFATSAELFERILINGPLHAVASYYRDIVQLRLEEIQKKKAAAALLLEKASETDRAESFPKPSATPVTSES